MSAKTAPNVVQASLFGEPEAVPAHPVSARTATKRKAEVPESPVVIERPQAPFKTLRDLLGPDGDPAIQQLISDAESGRASHAYLIEGRNGERNWDVARAFALSLLCEKPGSGNPCGTCKPCRAVIGQGAHPDLHVLEAGGASLKIEQVRDLRSFFCYGSSTARHHVFLIRGPERFTPPTAASLLKAIEEPAPGAVFILVSEEDRPPLETIISRCRTVVLSEPGAEAGAVDAAVSPEFEEIGRSLESGIGSALLKGLRAIGKDRDAAKRLLQHLIGHFEKNYSARKTELPAHPEEALGLMVLGDCIDMILRGLKQLEANASVNLLLAVLLRDVQQALAR
jgi:hypothetical protein